MISYKSAGVNDEKAETLVDIINQQIRKTSFYKKLYGGIGFFGGFMPVPNGYKKPFFVSSCDGVGTKILVAKEIEKYDTIGIDLVAMNCNDIAVCGAKALFFLDYLAVGKLKIEREKKIIEGIVKGCEIAHCALIGGETAQMPGLYSDDEFDLAGFCVGIVEKKEILGPARVNEDDILLGIYSNGIHSNGFSLARKVLFGGGRIKGALLRYHESLGRSLGEELLRPTYIYSTMLSELCEKKLIHAAAHITGGGIPGNLVRILPENFDAEIDPNTWNIPKIFQLIQEKGRIKTKEMFNVFNMGIGLILACSENSVADIKAYSQKHGFRVVKIGNICKGKGKVKILKRK
ncbi:MAG TPA: phosphoribosylformylglycinamidine cyclo-ligase [bacterium]|nr:phosphoribosylformylglycinamidine cyclo-ligase [bacterium]